MAQKTLKRKDYLQKDSQQLEAQQLEFQLKEDKQQLAADLLATERKLGDAERKLSELLSEDKLSPTKIIEAREEVSAYKAGVKALQDLEKELF